MELKAGQKVSGKLITLYAVELGPNAHSNRPYDAYFYLKEEAAEYMAAGMHDNPDKPKKTANVISERRDAKIHERLALKLDGKDAYFIFAKDEAALISVDGEDQHKRVKNTIWAILTPLERKVAKSFFDARP